MACIQEKLFSSEDAESIGFVCLFFVPSFNMFTFLTFLNSHYIGIDEDDPVIRARMSKEVFNIGNDSS